VILVLCVACALVPGRRAESLEWFQPSRGIIHRACGFGDEIHAILGPPHSGQQLLDMQRPLARDSPGSTARSGVLCRNRGLRPVSGPWVPLPRCQVLRGAVVLGFAFRRQTTRVPSPCASARQNAVVEWRRRFQAPKPTWKAKKKRA